MSGRCDADGPLRSLACARAERTSSLSYRAHSQRLLGPQMPDDRLHPRHRRPAFCGQTWHLQSAAWLDPRTHFASLPSTHHPAIAPGSQPVVPRDNTSDAISPRRPRTSSCCTPPHPIDCIQPIGTSDAKHSCLTCSDTRPSLPPSVTLPRELIGTHRVTYRVAQEPLLHATQQ